MPGYPEGMMAGHPAGPFPDPLSYRERRRNARDEQAERAVRIHMQVERAISRLENQDAHDTAHNLDVLATLMDAGLVAIDAPERAAR